MATAGNYATQTRGMHETGTHKRHRPKQSQREEKCPECGRPYENYNCEDDVTEGEDEDEDGDGDKY